MSGLRPAPRTVMTRSAFATWLQRNRIAVYVHPYEIVPCSCGDHNCHGWRLVARTMPRLAPVTTRESMLTEG